LSNRQDTSTGNARIPKIAYADTSKAEDARLANTLLQRFRTLAL
jgi:hypothetical protein